MILERSISEEVLCYEGDIKILLQRELSAVSRLNEMTNGDEFYSAFSRSMTRRQEKLPDWQSRLCLLCRTESIWKKVIYGDLPRKWQWQSNYIVLLGAGDRICCETLYF